MSIIVTNMKRPVWMICTLLMYRHGIIMILKYISLSFSLPNEGKKGGRLGNVDDDTTKPELGMMVNLIDKLS